MSAAVPFASFTIKSPVMFVGVPVNAVGIGAAVYLQAATFLMLRSSFAGAEIDKRAAGIALSRNSPLIVTSSDVSSGPIEGGFAAVAVIYTGLYFSIARRKGIAIYFTSCHSLSKLDAAVSNKSSCILCG